MISNYSKISLYQHHLTKSQDIAIPDSLIIYLDETESEVATDVHVVEDKNDSLKINSSDTLLRVSPIFSAVI
ncbi:hypothetical protein B1167_14825 [Enterococcus faecium]|nr:hypothetical protein B1167_14825 [Enterococcus faecium]